MHPSRLPLFFLFLGFVGSAACGVSLDPNSEITPSPDGGALPDGGGVLTPANGDAGDDADGGSTGNEKETIAEISPGGGFSCARTTKGRVFCWGINPRDGIGPDNMAMACTLASHFNGSSGPFNRCITSPFLVAGLGDVVKVAVGRFHACAVRRDGTMSCFGSNEVGGLGIGTIDDMVRPAPTGPGVTPKVIDVSLGFHASCALTKSSATTGPDEVWCWGAKNLGLLGVVVGASEDGNETVKVAVPSHIPALNGAKKVRVSHDYPHACAIDKDDEVVCWGRNHKGSSGHNENTGGDRGCFFPGGAQPCNPNPTKVNAGTKVIDLAVGAGFGCAITKDDNQSIKCWGTNDYNALGQAISDTDTHPTMLSTAGNLHATSIHATWRHVCAMTKELGLVCWGTDNAKQIGSNTTTNCADSFCTKPQKIMNPPDIASYWAGWEVTYFQSTSGAFFAVGNNGFALLGHPPGAALDMDCNGSKCSSAPAPIVFPF